MIRRFHNQQGDIVPKVFLQRTNTPGGSTRLTGRFRFDHGGTNEVTGEVSTDGLTGDDEIDRLILLARVVLAEGGYTVDLSRGLDFFA